jgi:hypothetical protein
VKSIRGEKKNVEFQFTKKTCTANQLEGAILIASFKVSLKVGRRGFRKWPVFFVFPQFRSFSGFLVLPTGKKSARLVSHFERDWRAGTPMNHDFALTYALP